MNKKILLVFVVLFVAALSISSVSALDLGFLSGDDSSNGSTTETIFGIDFNIPDTVTEDEDYAINNETTADSGITFTVEGKTFMDDDDNIMVILVSEYEDLEVTDEFIAALGGDEKTINGVDGYINHNDTFYTFSYPKDGKLVVFSTNNDEKIADFIIA